MSTLPLIDGVNKYINEENISFCMPGHKHGRGFLQTEEGKKLYYSFIKGDITEVDGVDNLHKAEGIIKNSQELLSKLYGSQKSYFLVNGSTSGNLAMIFSSFNEGDKVIVERNCHRSILNGIIMRKLKPIYIKNRLNKKYDAPFSISKEHFLKTLNRNEDAKGIILTYPNYYGVCTDLEEIINYAKGYHMKVLVDCAHGAHFGINHRLPENPMKLGATMAVMSAHKTLPSLTGTAFLHVGQDVDLNKVDFYVSAFLSTSPSYMLMMSMDYARYYMETYGVEDYKKLLNLCEKYRKKISCLNNFHVLCEDDINEDEDINENENEDENINENINTCLDDTNADYSGCRIHIREYKDSWKESLDLSRLVINLPRGYSGHKLLNYLRKNKIQVEMSHSRNIILIPSTFNCEEDFETLYRTLEACNISCLKEDYVEPIDFYIPKVSMQPYEVMDKQKQWICIKDSNGNICGEAIVPYPPGIPLVMPGELIDEKVILNIQYYLRNNCTVLGVEEGKLCVICEK